MKRFVIYSGLFLFLGQQSFGQCCPYVDPIEIIPASPSEIDSIYVVTNVTTPNQGTYLGYTILDYGSTIRIEACYYNGMLTALQTYTDTINLGVKPDGTYTIEFEAYQSGNDVICDYSDSNEVFTTVTVTPFLEVTETHSENQLFISLNPITNDLMYLTLENSDQPLSFWVYNTLGELVMTGEANSGEPVSVGNLQGVFFVHVFSRGVSGTRKILIP